MTHSFPLILGCLPPTHSDRITGHVAFGGRGHRAKKWVTHTRQGEEAGSSFSLPRLSTWCIEVTEELVFQSGWENVRYPAHFHETHARGCYDEFRIVSKPSGPALSGTAAVSQRWPLKRCSSKLRWTTCQAHTRFRTAAFSQFSEMLLSGCA